MLNPLYPLEKGKNKGKSVGKYSKETLEEELGTLVIHKFSRQTEEIDCEILQREMSRY